jgi:hypothetical protein
MEGDDTLVTQSILSKDRETSWEVPATVSFQIRTPLPLNSLSIHFAASI